MLFAAEEGPMLYQGQVIYVREDYALTFEPLAYSHCSVLIKDVELGFCFYFDTIKRATQVGGYCGSPTRWLQQRPSVPVFRPGRLLLLDETIEEGAIVGLEGSDTWGISYDPITSWLCFGETNSHEDDIAVAFATGYGVILRDNQLKALWVQPIFQ